MLPVMTWPVSGEIEIGNVLWIGECQRSACSLHENRFIIGIASRDYRTRSPLAVVKFVFGSTAAVRV
jgi:hypothetical protein